MIGASQENQRKTMENTGRPKENQRKIKGNPQEHQRKFMENKGI